MCGPTHSVAAAHHHYITQINALGSGNCQMQRAEKAFTTQACVCVCVCGRVGGLAR